MLDQLNVSIGIAFGLIAKGQKIQLDIHVMLEQLNFIDDP